MKYVKQNKWLTFCHNKIRLASLLEWPAFWNGFSSGVTGVNVQHLRTQCEGKTIWNSGTLKTPKRQNAKTPKPFFFFFSKNFFLTTLFFTFIKLYNNYYCTALLYTFIKQPYNATLLSSPGDGSDLLLIKLKYFFFFFFNMGLPIGENLFSDHLL